MNSLTELNGYNNSFTISYTDNRITDVLFDRAVPTNQTITANEGSSFESPLGIDVLDVVNPNSADLTYTFTFTGPVGILLVWDPGSGATTEYLGNGVWRASNITKSAWDIIKQPQIRLPSNLPNAFFGTFTYTVTIEYTSGISGNVTLNYVVTVNVLDVELLTNPLTFAYFPDSTSTITNTPQISNVDATYPGAIWTVTGTPSNITAIDNINSTYNVGGTFSINSSTKVFTITGNREEVNNHLSSLNLTSNEVEIDFTISYYVTNQANSISDTKTQTIRNANIRYLTNPDVSYYQEDSISTITNAPSISDVDYTGTGTYTLTVTPLVTANVTTLSSLGIPRTEMPITVSGSAAISTAIKRVGTGSVYLNNSASFGSNNVLSFPLRQTTMFGNFNGYTVEGWVYYTAWQNTNAGVTGEGASSFWTHGKFDGFVATSFGFNKQGKITFNYTTSYTQYGTNTIQESTTSGVLNTWIYIAMVKNANTITLYVNGVAKASGTITATPIYNENSGLTNRLGSAGYGSTLYIDEFRMSKVARYTGNSFTVPTSLTNDNDTVVLLRGDGTNGSTSISDDIAIYGNPSGGTSSFNNSTKVLTISGTKTQVNEHLDNLSIKTAQDLSQQFQLVYNLTTPLTYTANKIQNLIANSNDTEISNLTISRNYISNIENSIFSSNTPQIIDLDYTDGNLYSVTISANSGTFSYSEYGTTPVSFTNSITLSGNRTKINQELPTVKFLPRVNVFSTIDMTVIVSKNSVQISNQTVPLVGTFGGTYLGVREIIFTTSQTFSPTNIELEYSQFDILIVGGGGGGGVYGGGGGGGGEVKYITNQLFDPLINYNVIVGSGGIAYTGSDLINVTKSGDGGTSQFGTITASGGEGGYHQGGRGGNYGGTGGLGGTGQSLTRFQLTLRSAGGGGGAQGNGTNGVLIPPANGDSAGNGGDGIEINIPADPTYNFPSYQFTFSGGGGGALFNSNGSIGLGNDGGGNGGNNTLGPTIPMANRGGGGGGGGGPTSGGGGATPIGSNGASGYILLRIKPR